MIHFRKRDNFTTLRKPAHDRNGLVLPKTRLLRGLYSVHGGSTEQGMECIVLTLCQLMKAREFAELPIVI